MLKTVFRIERRGAYVESSVKPDGVHLDLGFVVGKGTYVRKYECILTAGDIKGVSSAVASLLHDSPLEQKLYSLSTVEQMLPGSVLIGDIKYKDGFQLYVTKVPKTGWLAFIVVDLPKSPIFEMMLRQVELTNIIDETKRFFME